MKSLLYLSADIRGVNCYVEKIIEKRKKVLEKELLFFLSYYKEVSSRSEKVKDYFDSQIEIITEKLKEIGH